MPSETLIEQTDRVLAAAKEVAAPELACHLCSCEAWITTSYDGEPCCEDCYQEAKMRELEPSDDQAADYRRGIL